MKKSNCCQASIIDGTDMCSKCKEYCEVEEDVYVAQRTVMKGGRIKINDHVYHHQELRALIGELVAIYRDDLQFYVIVEKERLYLFG